jgi:hypothetical protein
MRFFIEDSPWVFLLMTIILGGGAALLAGRSLASGWRPLWLLMLYMVPFTLGMRFLHFALFEATLSSLHYFLTDGLIFVACALLGYRVTRVGQMISQYPWLYERSGPLSWKNKAG